MRHDQILVLMGPTASGKSALAMQLAEKVDGVILNADAMQCYADLHIITARPSAEEMAQVPHRLYGIWGWDFSGNAAAWRKEAITAINAVLAAGQTPILVGGTGMYIRTLMEGIAPIPPISDAVRQLVADIPHEERYGWLQARDPETAAILKPGDKQRIQRAMEVWAETGKNQRYWQGLQEPPIYDPARFACFKVDIPRDILYARINQRFDNMMEMGALDEVRALVATIEASAPSLRARPATPAALLERMGADRFAHKDVDHRYPLLKSHGLPELMAHLRGEMSLDEALEYSKQNTRKYAKRQMTWLRNQMLDAVGVAYDEPQIALKAVDLLKDDG